MNHILVTGSTGNVGRPLVQQLAWEGLPVRAATRNPQSYPATAYPATAYPATDGVTPIAFDFADPHTYAPALAQVNRVFLVCPPVANPHEEVLPFVAAAAIQGCKIVLLTAMGTEYDENGSLRQVERAIERSGCPYVFLRPNWFMDNFHTMWLEPILHAGIIPVPAADSLTSFIDARDIAASAAAALQSDQWNGAAFTLTGPEALSYADAARILSAVTGRTVRYQPVDDASFRGSLLTAGVPASLADYLTALFGFVREGATAPVIPSVEELTGTPARAFSEYVQDHAALWQPAAPSAPAGN